MSCCGKKRNELLHQHAFQQIHTTEYNFAPAHADVQFEYTGPTALTATGAVTGKKYRFAHKGNIQAIDYRDAASMLAIPVLKKVSIQ